MRDILLLVAVISQVVLPSTAAPLSKRTSVLPLGYASNGPNGQQVPAGLLSSLKTYTQFAAAAYCTPTQIRNWNCKTCIGGPTNVSYFGDYNNMQGYVAAYPSRETILVSFKGSSNLLNWVANLQMAQTDSDFCVAGSKVHSGFLQQYNAVKSSVRSLVDKYTKDFPGYSVTFVGHSLGGAVALLAGMDAACNKYVTLASNQYTVMTVGSPRVGNAIFAQSVYDQGIAYFRGVHDNDQVPHLPPKLTLLSQPSQSSGFTHADYENYETASGTVQYCDDGKRNAEGTGCSNYYENRLQSISAHLTYYGYPVSTLAC
ncbi:hypothetical protein HK104_001715 [Borealophlyctis nickersoniae]|nr:hypothetical protein HK104_001715 [Borealophlyctis nickersoniae]